MVRIDGNADPDASIDQDAMRELGELAARLLWLDALGNSLRLGATPAGLGDGNCYARGRR